MRHFAIVFATFAVLATGCSRKKAEPEGFPPAADLQATGDLPPPPSVGPGALGGQGGDMGGGMGGGNVPNDDVHAGVRGGGGGGGGGDMGGGAGGVEAMGFQSPDPNRPVDPNKFVRGTIQPSAEFAAKIPSGAVIYVSIKTADPKTGEGVGMPVATLKLTSGAWPLPFELTERNMMTADSNFSGDVVVTARYAQNPDPLMKQSGDVVGKMRVTIPADKLAITLDSALP
jgi:hypothetical protein